MKMGALVHRYFFAAMRGIENGLLLDQQALGLLQFPLLPLYLLHA